ncbi:MAG: MBOAT family protein [Lachnospiraceae bacterium]|nr:MBOAT family protein [Lachnospiraceae bacterium]
MLFNSIQFLIFFPLVLIVYFLIPEKIRHFWLLVCSYYFYMCWNARYAILILISTVITYLSGVLIEKAGAEGKDEAAVKRRKKCVVALSLISNLGILFFFKYINFFFDTIAQCFHLAHIELNMPQFDILLPVGISFYTFQALGYTLDVYRGEMHAEKDFFKYALFVSFFPQLVAGPIERSKSLLSQLAAPKKFDFENFREGVLLMLWGYFLKLVIADRVAVFVDAAYGDCVTYPGIYLVVATVLFAIQIYCDFAGYSTIALGAAKILGIKLTDNFNAPYLATSVTDFWRRWHISLTSWFRDYLYFPLGGNRKGKARKYLNKLIVFLISGLWHGASFSFVIWGGLNGIYQIGEEMLKPFGSRMCRALRIHEESPGYRLLGALRTFILVDFAWVFFRAQTVKDSLMILKQMFGAIDLKVLYDGSLFECGLDKKNFILMLLSIALLFVADILKNRGVVVREVIQKQNFLLRSVFVACSITLIMIFGKYGPAYDAASFIYFQF